MYVTSKWLKYIRGNIMKSKLSKFALMAGIMLALAFTSSCFDNEDDEDTSVSSSSGGGDSLSYLGKSY